MSQRLLVQWCKDWLARSGVVPPSEAGGGLCECVFSNKSCLGVEACDV